MQGWQFISCSKFSYRKFEVSVKHPVWMASCLNWNSTVYWIIKTEAKRNETKTWPNQNDFIYHTQHQHQQQNIASWIPNLGAMDIFTRHQWNVCTSSIMLICIRIRMHNVCIRSFVVSWAIYFRVWIAQFCWKCKTPKMVFGTRDIYLFYFSLLLTAPAAAVADCCNIGSHQPTSQLAA